MISPLLVKQIFNKYVIYMKLRQSGKWLFFPLPVIESKLLSCLRENFRVSPSSPHPFILISSILSCRLSFGALTGQPYKRCSPRVSTEFQTPSNLQKQLMRELPKGSSVMSHIRNCRVDGTYQHSVVCHKAENPVFFGLSCLKADDLLRA